MAILVKNVRVIDPLYQLNIVDDVLISREEIAISPKGKKSFEQIIDGKDLILAPGFIDLHVHFREPGFTYKETIDCGIKAALAGGVTSALVMPNTLPPIDRPKHVAFQKKRAQKLGFDLMVAAAASQGLKGCAPSDLASLKHAGISAVTDDGGPILSSSLMEEILRQCRLHNLLCMQHAEDIRLSGNASVHEGKASKKRGVLGQPAIAEFGLIARDIALAERIGARYHVLHLSCKESLKLVKKAKANKTLISCEVTPHHLLLTDDDAMDFDTHKKMNPPLRTKEDRDALLAGLMDQSIDAVASDHAPHSIKDKRMPFINAPFGVVGLETAILVLLTLVKRRKLSLMRAIELMTSGPARILGESHRIGSLLGDRRRKNAVLIDPVCTRILSRRHLFGQSKNSPFFGMELSGRVLATFLNGEMVYQWSES